MLFFISGVDNKAVFIVAGKIDFCMVWLPLDMDFFIVELDHDFDLLLVAEFDDDIDWGMLFFINDLEKRSLFMVADETVFCAVWLLLDIDFVRVELVP